MKNKKKWRYIINRKNIINASFFYSNYSKQLEKWLLECSTIIWHATKKCNLNCIHCWVNGWDYKWWELTINDMISFIPLYKQIWVKYFLITWWEPTLKTWLLDFILELKKNWIKVWLSSNLITFNEKILKNIDTLQVSLDWFEESHNYIRNNNLSYKITTSNLKKITNLNIGILTISTIIYEKTLDNLEEFIKYVFKEFPINSLSLKPVFSYWRAIWKNDLYIWNKDFLKFINIVKKCIYEWYDVLIPDEFWYLKSYDTDIKIQKSYDNTWRSYMYLMENWDIKWSDQPEIELEWNILKDDLVSVWNNGFTSFRNRKLISDKCTKCKYYEKCWWWYLATIYGWKDCKVDIL